jgi:hypothetical protein
MAMQSRRGFMKAVIGAVIGGGIGAATGEDEKPKHQQLFDFQGRQRQVAKDSSKGGRMLKGAVAGFVVGAGIDLVANVNTKENAELGAFQNADEDEKRREWLLRIQEERDERERQAREREESDRERDGRGW